jgi:hypothetical protein
MRLTKPFFLQAIGGGRHRPAGQQHLLTDGIDRKGPLMQKCFQYAKITVFKPVSAMLVRSAVSIALAALPNINRMRAPDSIG